MRPFPEIEQQAVDKLGSLEALEERLPKPLSAQEVADIPDDRWLSEASKAVFQAGFSWKVINNKWPNFEEAFNGFNLNFCQFLADEQLEDMMSSGQLVKHWAKTASIRDNADYFLKLSKEHGSVGKFFASWSRAEYADRLQQLQKESKRLGGKTGQIFLRRMGVDTLVFSNDVLNALKAEGSIAKMPTSKTAWRTVQELVDQWESETDRSLDEISMILALSLD